ncbi:MAG: VOC family protein [Candidatus Geothermarchaeales archaeon]
MDGTIQSLTVGISVSDLAEVTECYRNLLGPRRELDPVPKIREFKLIEDFWLQLVEVKRGSKFSPVIRIGVDDLDRQHDRLSNLGIELGRIEEVPDLIRYFSLEDPYGNRLSYYELL